ncbi:MAG: glycosyl hydrolase family 65 protein, partial [Spirochaetota bacterium]
TYTCPEIAEALIRYRNTTLPAARARAAELHHRGCLYPWRTIDGREASAYFPAGTAQYHINADIAYAIKRHARARNAEGLPADFAAEILFEAARFWDDFGDYIEGKGFCINMVTGPDEYTAMVDNNCFTNLMARDNLEYAARTARKMRAETPERYHEVAEKIGLVEEEITDWERAAEAMYIPYDEELGIYPQDDGFLRKAEWDFENTPRENYPLLLHYHPLTIYRYQVLKQPDLVLALFLQSRLFSLDEKRRNYAYYDRLTTGDSSLAACVQGILATETGDPERGYEYFLDTLYMDLDDINRNTRDGIHAAAMGGVWLGLVYGFAGMRDDGEILRFSPSLPGKITHLAFSLAYRGGTLHLDITGERTVYSREGPAVEIDHRDDRIRLGDGCAEARGN